MGATGDCYETVGDKVVPSELVGGDFEYLPAKLRKDEGVTGDYLTKQRNTL
jgi:hypothetical protein